MEELVDLIDELDRVIGMAPRSLVRGENLLHRGVGILVRNPAGEIYVHRRTETKDVFPGLYDMFVGGMVGAGEAYEEAARRETEEELGVRGAELTYLFTHRYEGQDNNCFIGVYETRWDGEIVHQEEPVTILFYPQSRVATTRQLEGFSVSPVGYLVWRPGPSNWRWRS